MDRLLNGGAFALVSATGERPADGWQVSRRLSQQSRRSAVRITTDGRVGSPRSVALRAPTTTGNTRSSLAMTTPVSAAAIGIPAAASCTLITYCHGRIIPRHGWTSAMGLRSAVIAMRSTMVDVPHQPRGRVLAAAVRWSLVAKSGRAAGISLGTVRLTAVQRRTPSAALRCQRFSLRVHRTSSACVRWHGAGRFQLRNALLECWRAKHRGAGVMTSATGSARR